MDTDSELPEPTPLLRPAEGVPPITASTDEIRAAAQRLLSGTGAFAVDAERASGFRYSNRAYLIQIRRRGAGTVLLDPTNVPGSLGPIVEALGADEWILHAADQDLPCLAELDMKPPSLYDTELAGRLAGFEKVNLASMVHRLLGLGLAKGHGAADWSKRPLPDDWLNYAALDVEVLVELRDKIAEVLAEQGKTEWARQEFEHLAHTPVPATRRDNWRRTSGIHKVRKPGQLAAVRELWLSRDELARARDVAPGRTLPDSAIVEAALADPKTRAELIALPVFGGPRQKQQADRWLAALAKARSGTAPPPVNEPTPGPHRYRGGGGANPRPTLAWKPRERPWRRSPNKSRCPWRTLSLRRSCGGSAGTGTDTAMSTNNWRATAHVPGSGSSPSPF
ncbi:Conserved hypothetical protein (putative exonuclease) [Mycobacteroides abscessus]|nr:Conserved hypothetical protein (putative exonuclease) [Mycobacteroides abscessus]